MSDSAIHSAAGALGGVVAMAVTYPLVFLSTRAAVETERTHKSTKQAVLDIVDREGVRGLYAGLHSSLWGIAATNGIYYYFYQRSKDAMLASRGSKALSTVESMLTGAIAGSITSTLTNPIWVIQSVQSTQTMDKSKSSADGAKPQHMTITQTLSHIIEKDGILGLFRGLGPALVMVINPIIQYTASEQFQRWLIQRRTDKLRASGGKAVAVLSDWDFFLIGALSKLVATGSSYPYLVIKSRMQAGRSQYKSSLQALLTIMKTEGVAGLYKGIANKLIQSVLTAAVLFATQRRLYEVIKKMVSVHAARIA